MKGLVFSSYAFMIMVLVTTVFFWRGTPGQIIEAGIDRGIKTSSIQKQGATGPQIWRAGKTGSQHQ